MIKFKNTNKNEVVQFNKVDKAELPQHRGSTSVLGRVVKWGVVVVAVVAVIVVGMWLRLEYAGEVEAAFSISQSLRFNDDDSAYLSRTFSAPTSQNVFTFSTWVKRANISSLQNIFGVSTNYSFGFPAADTLAVTIAGTAQATTAGLWRDPAVWMHIMYVQNGTAITIYMDGDSAATGTGTNSAFNTAAAHQIGAANTSNYLDGYLSDVYFIDGSALTPTSFGETDANGYWRPKAYSGSYGTNGFHLDFAASGDLGNDVSGNNNDWTGNNLDATDQVVDTPTNSYATLSPLSGTTGSPSNGSLVLTGAGVQRSYGTIGVLSGKFYWENNIIAVGSGVVVGISNNKGQLDSDTDRYGYYSVDGHIYDIGDLGAYGNTYTTGDVIGVALDMDNGKLFFSKNDVWQNSGDPVGGTNPARSGLSGYYNPFVVNASSANINLNFGQNATSSLTYDSSAGGYFKYTPPSGFKALSTANLPNPAVDVPKSYFDVFAYKGLGATRKVGSVKVFTTTGSSTWQVPSGVTSINVLVVGGGGGGGGAKTSSNVGVGGGGGAGGFVNNTTYAVTPGQNITVTVGAGGTGGGPSAEATNGGDSVFDTITATGGGAGGTYTGNAPAVGGSGGGGGYNTAGAAGTAGQGNAGGAHGAGADGDGGGGGGASAVGADGSDTGPTGGNGGAGTALSISGSSVTYAGGGGGGSDGGTAGSGGAGGGADGTNTNTVPTVATANTGGGGGGGGNGAGATTGTGGSGGSGIVILNYTSSFAFTPSLTWIKNRDQADEHKLTDSVRGATKELSSDSTNAETTDANGLTAFNSDGFSLGTGANGYNDSGEDFVAWNWKEDTASGFDIVTYTGTGANQTIAHSLSSSTPKFVIVKDRGGTNNWAVYHASNTAEPASDYLLLDTTAATADDATYWNDTSPGYTKLLLHGDGTDAATTFTESSGTANTHTITANGTAQIDTAQSKFGGASVLLDGNSDYLTVPASTDFQFGTGDFTIEFWVRHNTSNTDDVYYEDANFTGTSDDILLRRTAAGNVNFYLGEVLEVDAAMSITNGVWYHLAFVRNGTDVKVFKDGTQVGSTGTSSYDHNSGDVLHIGRRHTDGGGGLDYFDGWIDEFRISKGIARWTANFTAPTSAHSIDSTDDVFFVGTNADVNTNTNTYVAYLFAEKDGFSKFGSYTGNGSTDGPFVYTGFKPAFVMIRRTSSTGQWYMMDNERLGYNDDNQVLYANLTNAEAGFSWDLLSNGFKARNTGVDTNGSGSTFIYAAFAEQPFKYSAAQAATNFLQRAFTFIMGMTF